MKIPFASFAPWVETHWVTILVVILVVVLVGALSYWIWYRYSDAFKEQWEEFWRVREIHPQALTRIWGSFNRRLPFGMRRTIREYPVYLVLGDDRSGKSNLVSRCIIKDVLDYRYPSSSSADELMSVQLGNEAVIIELSASFLHSSALDHVEALVKLWRNLPANTHLVMTVDAYQMVTGNEESQQKIAEALIGKLTLLSEVNRRPVPFSLVLTHMDHMRGFNSCARFAIENNFDFQVRLTQTGTIPQFSNGLNEYLGYSANALVKCSTEDFIEMSNFLSGANRTLEMLQNFVMYGCLRNNLKSIRLQKICLFSNDDQNWGLGLLNNNPFLHDGCQDSFFDSLSRKHIKLAGVMGALLLLTVSSRFLIERYTLTEAARLINQMSAVTQNSYTTIVHPVFRKLYHNHTGVVGEPVGGHSFDFYPDQASTVRRHIAKALRATYLVPKLQLAQHQEYVYARTIRLLAILHANSQNELGQFFASPPGPDEDQVIPYEIIEDYIAFNDDLNSPDLFDLAETAWGTSKIEYPWVTINLKNLIADILEAPYIDSDKLESVKSIARNILIRGNRSRQFPYLDEERLWLTQKGHVSQETIEIWSRFPTEAQVSSSAVTQCLRMIVNTDIQPTLVPANFNHLLKQIQTLIEENKQAVEKNKLGIVDVQFAEEFYHFDTNDWLNRSLRSRIRALLEAYYERSSVMPGWVFFDEQQHALKIPMGISTDESGVLINNAQVDIRLTRESFENNVKPAVETMTVLIEDIPLFQGEKQRLLDFFIQHLSAYAGNYANAYWSFFRNMMIRIPDSDHLINYLKELQRPGSAFVQNLIRVKENVLIELPSGPNYQPVRDRLADFTFLRKLMAEQSGSYPELNRYIAIVSGLYEQLASGEEMSPPPSDKDAQAVQGLKGILTPLGRIALDMFTGSESSSLRRVEGWMREMAIPESWRSPFVIPMLKARDFGRNDIEMIIDREWHKLWDQQVVPLLAFFPFDHGRGGAADELAPDALSAVFHPANGSFWRDVRKIFGALYQIQEGRWAIRSDVERSFRLPVDMLARINAASNLTLALWDKESQPVSVHYKVRSELIPTVTPMTDNNNEPMNPSLVYLRSGGASVLGFNQKSLWQDLPFEWWIKSTANVGIEFKNNDEKARRYASLSVDETRWPLLKLLSQAEKNGLAYSWVVTLPEKPDERLKASFFFKNDPFDLFNALKYK